MAVLSHVASIVPFLCIWQVRGSITAARADEAHKPHHVATHKVSVASVPRMLNHGSSVHTHVQTHAHKQAMLNGPHSKHTLRGKDAAAHRVPKTSIADDIDKVPSFLWAGSTAISAEIWLPHVLHNTKIFRAELCAEREMDSEHYADCYAFMTIFCARTDDLWANLAHEWTITLQGFCDKFWAINSQESGQDEEQQDADQDEGATESQTTTHSTSKSFHQTVLDPLKSIGNAFNPTTTRAPPARKPIRVVEPAPSIVFDTDMCAHERGLSGTASRHCHEFMDEMCDPRQLHGHTETIASKVTKNCHDYYSHEEKQVYGNVVTSMFPAPAPAPGPAGSPGSSPGSSAYSAAWPPVDNQKKEAWDMPEQGFSGGPVSYDNGKMMTADWQREFGPKAAGFQSIRSICMQHPESEWCRLSGYHQPLQAAAVESAWVEPPRASSSQLWLALVLLAVAIAAAVALRMSSGN